MKIYVPSFNNGNCAYIQSEGVIRVYETTPTYNSSINYVEYFSSNHYVYRYGIQQFGNYSTLPICLDNSNVTTNIYYRNDLDSILICFFIIVLFCFYFPYKLISRCMGRWMKL